MSRFRGVGRLAHVSVSRGWPFGLCLGSTDWPPVSSSRSEAGGSWLAAGLESLAGGRGDGWLAVVLGRSGADLRCGRIRKTSRPDLEDPQGRA